MIFGSRFCGNCLRFVIKTQKREREREIIRLREKEKWEGIE